MSATAILIVLFVLVAGFSVGRFSERARTGREMFGSYRHRTSTALAMWIRNGVMVAAILAAALLATFMYLTSAITG